MRLNTERKGIHVLGKTKRQSGDQSPWRFVDGLFAVR